MIPKAELRTREWQQVAREVQLAALRFSLAAGLLYMRTLEMRQAALLATTAARDAPANWA
jgi:hypothetical protein